MAPLQVPVISLLLLAASGSLAQEPIIRSRNGIRIVGDDGPRGRLEVSTKDPKFPAVKNNCVAWVPVCDSSFTALNAEVMCKLLGYPYGRQYFAPEVNYPTNLTSAYSGGFLSCFARPPSISPPPPVDTAVYATGNAVASTAEDASAAEAEGPMGTEGTARELRATAVAQYSSGGGMQHRTARKAMSVVRYQIDTPSTAPYSCAFAIGSCDARGPLGGIECSYSPLLRTPPPPLPPPSPRPPPTAPPSATDSIRLLGGLSGNRTTVEPNLCAAMPPEFCTKYGRVELLVILPGGGGSQLWAPLCAVANDTLREQVARVACQQEYDWPSKGNVTSALPDTDPYFYKIPTGPVTSGADFNPATVAVWVTIGSPGVTQNPKTLQDFNLSLSSMACKKGNLFALSCDTRDA